MVFCTLVIVTGPIWAKGTWGHWWSWDPRLTVTLLQWFVYLSYLLLRSFTEGSTRTARFAAVYGIVGVLAVPLNYFAIDLFGGAAMHPENLERGSLGAGMGWPFAPASRRASPPTCTCCGCASISSEGGARERARAISKNSSARSERFRGESNPG